MVALVALAGCRNPGSAATTPQEASPASSDADADAESPAIGWAEITLPGGDPQVDLVFQNVGAEQALDAAPYRTDLRLAHAHALARDGRLDEAWTHLARALAEDLPQVRADALEHEDFRALRDAHPELPELVASLSQRYAEAMARGVPAFVYVPREGWASAESRTHPQTPHTDLRVGVYDPEFDRFVPLVPAVDGAWSGALDRANARALVVTGTLSMSMWLVRAERADARVYSLTELGALVFDAGGLEVTDMAGYVSVALDPKDGALWVERDEISGIDYYERIDEEGLHEAGMEGAYAAEEVPIAADFFSGPPSVSLDLQTEDDDEDNGASASHAWGTTDIPPAIQAKLAERDDVQAVRCAGDGTIVVETDAGLTRLRPPDYAPEPALAGVHLRTPEFPAGEGGA